MESGERHRAVRAAVSAASALDLLVEDTTALSDSNRLVLRLMPCDVVVRIAPTGYRVFSNAIGAAKEIHLVHRLALSGAPVAALDPRVEPRLQHHDGFDHAFMTYYEPVANGPVSPGDYSAALERLHSILGSTAVEAPHFTDRATDVEGWVARRDIAPGLSDDDRALLVETIAQLRQSISDRGADEQVLHGEPHPWNVLDTHQGPLFIDLENCVRGPIEFDLGWVPTDVSASYPDVDQDLVNDCRGLVLGIVAAHAWRRSDERPGQEAAEAYLDLVRRGPPWPSL